MASVEVRELLVPLPLRRKIVLALEIFRAYVHVRRLLRRKYLPTVVRELRGAERSGEGLVAEDGAARAAGLRLGSAVSRFLPFDSRCLIRSLVLTELLARRRIDATLVIGVASEPKFGAHAWVESGGSELLPSNGAQFQPLVSL